MQEGGWLFGLLTSTDQRSFSACSLFVIKLCFGRAAHRIHCFARWCRILAIPSAFIARVLR